MREKIKEKEEELRDRKRRKIRKKVVIKEGCKKSALGSD